MLFMLRSKIVPRDPAWMDEEFYYYRETPGLEECMWYIPFKPDNWQKVKLLKSVDEAVILKTTLVVAGSRCDCVVKDVEIVGLEPGYGGGWRLVDPWTGYIALTPINADFGASAIAGGGAPGEENAQGEKTC